MLRDETDFFFFRDDHFLLPYFQPPTHTQGVRYPLYSRIIYRGNILRIMGMEPAGKRAFGLERLSSNDEAVRFPFLFP